MVTLAYDGSEFHGWQFQPEMRTVQGCLEQGLRRVLRHQVLVIGCSRTDAGVHAAGHVANCYTTHPGSIRALARSLGSRLPKDMTVLHMGEVPLTFHATHTAVSKLYRYRIYNAPGRPCQALLQRFVYHCWQPLDIATMRQAAAVWVGTHDFSSFASAGNVRDSNVRTILRIEIYRAGREMQIDIEGTGFLYKQVRNMVGTLVEIGRGRWTVTEAADILRARDRARAGPTAPARGLCLQWVRYDIPSLPPPPPELLARAEKAQPPAGALCQDEEVEGRPRSTAPMPPGVDTEEEPSG
jgi:tRNA pseudouridine38-40 synthase